MSAPTMSPPGLPARARSRSGTRPARGAGATPDRFLKAAVAVAVAMHLALCAPALRRTPFWRDEAWTALVVRRPVLDMLRVIRFREANMALYYVLAHMWGWVVPGDAGLRAFSLLCSLGALFVIARVVRSMFGPVAAGVAVVLVAVNPLTVRYATEARSYALVLLLTSLAHLFFLRAWAGGERQVRSLVAYAIALALVVHAHFVAALVAVVHLGALTVGRRWSRRWLAAYAAVGAAITPILFVAATGHGKPAGVEKPRVLLVRTMLKAFAGGRRVDTLLCAALVVLAVVHARRRAYELRLVAATLVAYVAPVVVLWVVSQRAALFLDRYLLFVLPPLAALVASGARLRIRHVPIGALLAVGVVGLWLDSAVRASTRMRVEDYRAAVAYVTANDRPGDVVLFAPSWARIGYDHYAEGKQGPRDVAVVPGGSALEVGDVIPQQRTDASLASIISPEARVWVVGYPGISWVISPEPGRSFVDARSADGTLVELAHETFGELDVTLFRQVIAAS